MQEAEGAVLVFTATLSHASSRTVTVDYATSDGTAVAGSDYTAASGTLTFNAGDTSQTVQVTVLTDSEDESQETLTLTLSNPTRPRWTTLTGTGTIENGESSSGTQEDPPAEDPPVVLLTASFANVPADHDGSNFTFDLTFSERRVRPHPGRRVHRQRRRHRQRQPHPGQQPGLDRGGGPHRQRLCKDHPAGNHRLRRQRRNLHG